MPLRSSSKGASSRKATDKAQAALEKAVHEEAEDLFQDEEGGGRSGGARRSSRVAQAETRRGDENGAVDDAIRVAKSLFPCPADEVRVYNVEGRGSCAPFALAVAMGLKLEHAAPSDDDKLTATVIKVPAKDRCIDLQLRSGARGIVKEHYEGGNAGPGFVKAADCFGPDIVHQIAKMTTKNDDGAWVSIEWLGFMAAFAGIRYLYVVNVDNKLVFVTRIDYDEDNHSVILRLEQRHYTFDEWSGAASFSTHKGKSNFKRRHDEDAVAEEGDLLRTFAVLISSGTSGESMHYVAVRPRDDSLVPFLQTVDKNERGSVLFEKFKEAQSASDAAMGQTIGRYVADHRKQKEAAPGLRWSDIPVRVSDRSEDDEEASDAAAQSAGRKKRGVRGEGSSAGKDMADEEDDEDAEDADAGKRAVRGEGSSDQKKPGDGLKPVVFHTRVFANRVNHEDVIDKKGAKEVDDKLNTELCSHFVTAPYTTTPFAELPKLAQWAAESLGWSASTWDSNLFTPKLDFSGAGAEKMPPEIRELIKLLHPELDKDQLDSLTHSYMIKRILGYSPLTWPGPMVKFGDFEEDVVMICEVIERIWLISARNSSDLLPGLTDDGDEADLNKIAVEFKDGKRLYFETTNFYNNIVDKILFKEGARRRPLRLTNEKDFLEWARNLAAIVVKEVQEVHHGEEQELDAGDDADLARWGSERVHETITNKGTNKGKTVKRLGLRHFEQHNAISSVLRDQEAIASLMLVDDNDYVVWMASGAKFKVPSTQLDGIFTKLFRDKLRSMPNKKFKVPIGHRSPSMTKLPQSFAALATSLVSKKSKECVGLAIALGLHAFGDLQNVALVKQHAALAVTAVENGRFSNELDYFKWFFQHYCPRLYTIKTRRMLTCESLYTLAGDLPQAILIINPLASDGNSGHAFCVHNYLIYDCAEERAMPLEQQWLDRCVQVDARDVATFACVKELLILQPTLRLLTGVKRLLDESDGQHKKTKV
mgnify:FL=1